MNKIQLEEQKKITDALYYAMQALAAAGEVITKRIEKDKQSNQLLLDVVDDATTINYIFDKDIKDTFIEGTEEELFIMREAYDNSYFVPALGSEYAAAYDIRAYLPPDNYNKVGTFALHPMETKIISTNLMVEVPIGYELVITPRSGLATKGITIGNAPGCVDSDYRGVVGVILYNNGGTPFILTHGDRIAQCKLKKLEPTNWNHVNKLSETSRGTGGFGHTGIK